MEHNYITPILLVFNLVFHYLEFLSLDSWVGEQTAHCHIRTQLTRHLMYHEVALLRIVALPYGIVDYFRIVFLYVQVFGSIVEK